MPSAPLEFKVNSQDLADLFKAAKAAEGKIQVELRRGIKTAAKPIVDGVKAEASFSSRIPGAVKVKAGFASKGATVTVIADPKAAPEAAPLNNGDRGGNFRHPVYGNRENWVSQPAHPFFVTGAKHGAPAAEQAMLKVMDDIAHQLGFH
jgi:hypothetical protein